MKMKTIFLISFMGILSVSAGWWFSKSSIEQWLLLNKEVAEAHASSLFEGVFKPTPEALLDKTISANDGVMFLAFHDEPQYMLAYVSSESKANILTNDIRFQSLKSLGDKWYFATVSSK